MHRSITIGLAMAAGAALGAAAVESLHAQARMKAYAVTEFEVLDATANTAYVTPFLAAVRAAGGRGLGTGGQNVVAFVGNAPQHVAIQEYDSLEQVQAFFNSAAYKNLAPQRDRAEKTIRQYAVGAVTN